MNNDIAENTAEQFITILDHPEKYPAESLAQALFLIEEMKNNLELNDKKIRETLLRKMKENKATKVIFVDRDQNERVCTIRSGGFVPLRNAEEIYKNAGFDPLEIGKYEFKPSWLAAKGIKTLGGRKAEVLDMIFQQQIDKLEIK